MKSISKKSITFSIILLFIGVSFSSGISIKTETTTIEDCDCNKVSNADLIRVEGLLDKFEIYSKLLLVLSMNNPKIKEEIEVISNRISVFAEDNWIEVIICEILLIVGSGFSAIVVIIDEIMDKYPEDGLIYRIFTLLENSIRDNIFDTIDNLGEYYDCGWMP